MIEFKTNGLLITPPERIIDYISGYCRGINRYEDIIVAVICKDEGLIKNEILLFEDDSYVFNNDWWEGGDVVLVGFCFIDDIPIYNNPEDMNKL